MEKLNVIRCTHLYAVDPERAVRGEDEARLHLWGSAPVIEQTEHGPVAWWLCGRCPARVLHDPETEDGFPEEPIVVYPPSCFDESAVELFTNETGITCPACASPEVRQFDLPDATRYRHAKSHVPGRTRCALKIGPLVFDCGCPRRASGDVVHLDGCVDQNARVEAHLRELDEEAGFTGPLSLADQDGPLPPDGGTFARLVREQTDRTQRLARRLPPERDWKDLAREALSDGRLSICGAQPEPPIIVHPPTEPAPPSEELRRAIDDDREEVIAQLMADTGCTREQAERDLHETLRLKAAEDNTWEGDEDEEPPTLKRVTPVHVESASSIFERVERLFGRPILGDAR